MRGCRRGLTFSLLLLAMSAFGQQDQAPAPSAASPTSASADKAARAPASLTDGSQTREPARPLPDLTPDANGALSQEQMRALTRVVAENYRANYKQQRDYTYIEREVQKKLDGKGQLKSTEVRTYEVMAIYGEQFERLIEKDDKPLSEKDAAKEEERIQRDVEAMDTASIGWVLARIHKGTRLVYEQIRVNDEVWLPEHLNFKLDARIALFKGYNEEAEQTYRDYRKFRTGARVVGVGE